MCGSRAIRASVSSCYVTTTYVVRPSVRPLSARVRPLSVCLLPSPLLLLNCCLSVATATAAAAPPIPQSPTLSGRSVGPAAACLSPSSSAARSEETYPKMLFGRPLALARAHSVTKEYRVRGRRPGKVQKMEIIVQ